MMFLFFFSSRRRHTRLQGDWSSDVCSSDLGMELERRDGHVAAQRLSVNDRPARPPELLDDELAQGEHVGNEPVGAVAPAAVAGGRPGVAAGGKVRGQGGAADAATSRPFALVPVSEYDETAVPL